MPTAVKPITVGVKVTNGSQYEYVKVTNLTSGGTITGQLNADKECVLNSEESNLTWNAGDALVVSIAGRLNQNVKITAKGGARTTLGRER